MGRCIMIYHEVTIVGLGPYALSRNRCIESHQQVGDIGAMVHESYDSGPHGVVKASTWSFYPYDLVACRPRRGTELEEFIKTCGEKSQSQHSHLQVEACLHSRFDDKALNTWCFREVVSASCEVCIEWEPTIIFPASTPLITAFTLLHLVRTNLESCNVHPLSDRPFVWEKVQKCHRRVSTSANAVAR